MTESPSLPLDKILPLIQGQLGFLFLILVVTLIPFAVMMMTSFTRITIIFHFLKQALGLTEAPSSQILMALSLVLTAFIMQPVFSEIYTQAYLPATLEKEPHIDTIVKNAWHPLRTFMLKQTRDEELALFSEIAQSKVEDKNALAWYIVIPSFILSELRYAFLLGFLLLLPFLVIDLVVSSVLTTVGLVAISPAMIALPLKILLFILVDGWHLIVKQIVQGFNPFISA